MLLKTRVIFVSKLLWELHRLECFFFFNSQSSLHQAKQGSEKKILKLSCEVSYTSMLLSVSNFVSFKISCERRIIFTIKKSKLPV